MKKDRGAVCELSFEPSEHVYKITRMALWGRSGLALHTEIIVSTHLYAAGKWLELAFSISSCLAIN